MVKGRVTAIEYGGFFFNGSVNTLQMYEYLVLVAL